MQDNSDATVPMAQKSQDDTVELHVQLQHIKGW